MAVLLGGCAGHNARLQDLLSLPAPVDTDPQSAVKTGTETAADAGTGTAPRTGSLATRPEPQETSTLVAGSPTGIFAAVARGALGCWFAADGPLKASHIYRAEAAPPAKGGDAEILLYERDGAMRDLRGPRAYRVAFTSEMSGVRVTMTALRLEPKVAQAMANDVESWARNRESCRLRAVLPPPEPPPVVKASKASKASKPPKAGKAPKAGEGQPAAAQPAASDGKR